MSLVGNLEDLSLGDIMQIISLSQKSGVLALKGEEGAGRIVFRAGLVHAACLEGRPDDLRDLLVASGSIDETTFDAFAAHAEKVGCPVAELLVQKSDLTPEEIDALLRESVESAILEMFSWHAGDFSFDVRNQTDEGDPQVVLSAGVNAQYLAMEGMRICDERSRDKATGVAKENVDLSSVDSSSLDSAQPTSDAFFGDERLDVGNDLLETEAAGPLPALEVDDDVTAADVLVANVLSNQADSLGLGAESEPVEAIDVGATAALDHAVGGVRDTVAAEPDAAASRVPSEAPAPRGAGLPPASQQPLVLIDPDVTVLEWAKAALQAGFSRIHAFQQAEQGLARIRQYLIRGEFPVVLISTRISIDPLSGIHGLADFVSRLKAQAAKLVVAGLHEDTTVRDVAEAGEQPVIGAFDRVVSRPSGQVLRAGGEALREETTEAFVSAVQDLLGAKSETTSSRSKPVAGADAALIRHLRDATTALQEASSRGEILPVVLDFAAEIFARVAILIVRDAQVFAIAGRGIDALEVDPLNSSPPVSLPTQDGGWVRLVLDTGKPVVGPPTTPADQDLLARFGGLVPQTSYLGPIESSGVTVAMLYCDQAAAGEGEMPDTSGLEVVLQHAGLALDRAALERALWEADGQTD